MLFVQSVRLSFIRQHPDALAARSDPIAVGHRDCCVPAGDWADRRGSAV